jgi:hypothetical protein
MAATRVIRRLRDLQDVHTVVDPGLGAAPVDDGTGVYPLTRVSTTDDVDAILAGVAHVDWRPLPLEPGLAPFGDGFAPPQYRLTLNNVVHLEGMVACSPPISDDHAGRLLTRVAADSLPSGTLLFGCPAWQNNARVDVLPDGQVTFGGMLIGGGQIDWFSLSGIHYSVGAAS